MKEKRRRLETFSFYDHTGIEAHLRRMAEQGWLLEKIGFLWCYRRIEPKRLTFSVNYFPKASQFDPGPSEEQEAFYDFCQHTGWTLAAASAQMQVFCNERPDPVPIDTDPALEIETIHQAAKRNWLLSMFSLFVMSVLNLVMFLFRLFENPVESLSSASLLFTLADYTLLFLLLAVELTSYYSWRRRAKRAAEQGEFLPTRSHPMFPKIVLVLVTVGLIWLLVSLAFGGNPRLALVMGTTVCGTFAVVAVIWGISGVLKQRKVSADANCTITILLTVALTFLVVTMIPLIIITTYSGESQRSLDRGQLPLTLPELLGVSNPGEDWGWDVDITQSPLLGRLRTNQHLGKRPVEYRWMTYTVVEVRAPFLYELCRDNFLNQWKDRVEWNRSYEPVDPAPWGAESAYLEYDAELGAQNQYLLCYPDRVVEVCFDWDVTPEQMALAGERLGG